MVKKTKKDRAVRELLQKKDDTQEDRDAHITNAYSELKKAKTASAIREVWKEHYLIIGHRVLGRLLLGQDAESATRTRQKSEES